ncbi:MAG TPA: TldD/PmbA family protein [Acidimicrobiales bacterium]|nr:TldD/PmbA family protein [Acidimicrobiales bacterium]
MHDLAAAAVEAALAAGARYADARVAVARHELLAARNGTVEEVAQDDVAGIGVRALVGSSWGFQATPELAASHARAAGAGATAVARASARVPGPPIELAPAPVVVGSWSSTWVEHPLDEVGLAERADLLVAATAAAVAAGVPLSRAASQAWDRTTWFASSEGARIEQRVVECGAVVDATAVGDGETQRRSYPGVRGQYGTRGWELVRELDLVANAARMADQAQALLGASACPVGRTTLILDSSQTALQVHESVGHAVELDRILGWEAGFAGTSWLDPRGLGTLRFGSELMQVTADATLPGALGSFGYDDEGVAAQAVDIVRDGRWVGVLSGRDSAPALGLRSGGMVRADGPGRLPMVRMTNVGLLPGDSSLDEMIAGTERGVYMESNRSWSIDDRRLNFQFGCEIGWEVEDGVLGRMVRNPGYTGIGPTFWASLDAVGGPDEWTAWGLPTCGKGQPLQVGHTGHPAAPTRFRDVRVGVR